METHEWKVFFERDLIPSNVSVGMYDSSRDAVAAAILYLNSINEEQIPLNTTNPEHYDRVEDLLKNNFFSQWGTDELKTAVVSQNLDIALVYSGDFFDQYYFLLETERKSPLICIYACGNNIWFDAMVIPNTATKIDLAHNSSFFLDIDNVQNTIRRLLFGH